MTFGPFSAMPGDGEAMRFVAQPLHEIEHRIAGLELEWLSPRHEEGLQPGITVGPLGNRHQRYVGDAERDVQAAHAAAMPALVANYGYLRADEDSSRWNGDGYLNRPLDLLDWLKMSGRV